MGGHLVSYATYEEQVEVESYYIKSVRSHGRNGQPGAGHAAHAAELPSICRHPQQVAPLAGPDPAGFPQELLDGPEGSAAPQLQVARPLDQDAAAQHLHALGHLRGRQRRQRAQQHRHERVLRSGQLDRGVRQRLGLGRHAVQEQVHLHLHDEAWVAGLGRCQPLQHMRGAAQPWGTSSVQRRVHPPRRPPPAPQPSARCSRLPTP
jgi:hypothetical protein